MAGKLFVLLCSCSASEEWEETHIQPVSSLSGTSGRTLVCISKCVDYYVTVSNYTEYKDTYCWNEYYTVGSGGSDYYTGGEYDPGNLSATEQWRISLILRSTGSGNYTGAVRI